MKNSKNEILAIIEKTDNNFSAYLKEIDGIGSTGKTLDEVKRNMLQAIDDFVQICKEYKEFEIPEEFKKDFKIIFIKKF